jgi:predicted AAA+ superfamily ATPase
MQLLVGLLRERVGSPIVIFNLAEDLQVSPITVKKWIEVLEDMYVLFQVRPYAGKIPRALQKPPKIYFYDNADADGDEGARFEQHPAIRSTRISHAYHETCRVFA